MSFEFASEAGGTVRDFIEAIKGYTVAINVGTPGTYDARVIGPVIPRSGRGKGYLMMRVQPLKFGLKGEPKKVGKPRVVDPWDDRIYVF